MWQDFFAAMSLVLVIEGMLPFIKPKTWRKTMGRIAEQPDNALRIMGLMSMLLGLALLHSVKS